MARHGKARGARQPIMHQVDDGNGGLENVVTGYLTTEPTTLYYGGAVDGSNALVLWQDAQDSAEASQYLAELDPDADDDTVDGEWFDHAEALAQPVYSLEVLGYARDHGCTVEIAALVCGNAGIPTTASVVCGDTAQSNDASPRTPYGLKYRQDTHDAAWSSKVLQGNPDMVHQALYDAEHDYLTGRLESGEYRQSTMEALYRAYNGKELAQELIAYGRAYKQILADHVNMLFESNRIDAAKVNPDHKAHRVQRGPRGEKGRLQDAQIAATIAGLRDKGMPESVIDTACEILRAGFQAEAAAITARRKNRTDARKAAAAAAAQSTYNQQRTADVRARRAKDYADLCAQSTEIAVR